MSKSRGNLVFVSQLRRDGVDPMAIRLALLSRHYREDRYWTADALTEATGRLARWRSAAQRFGFDTTEVVAKLRSALSNDLDTVKAVKVVDQWAQNTSLGGSQVAAAVDALLGITLV
jgi:L-cysteine:1D-myo-inositol 2-amino-2-deoxy-alpha-D-glucopyranoside ligase